MFHQVSHEILDSKKKDSMKMVPENVFFLSSSMLLSGMLM